MYRKPVNRCAGECLSSICGVKIINKVRNVMIRRRCGNKLSLFERADRKVLRWFGHLGRMSDEKIKNEVERVDGMKRVGRLRRRWLINKIKSVLLVRGRDAQKTVHLMRDRNE